MGSGHRHCVTCFLYVFEIMMFFCVFDVKHCWHKDCPVLKTLVFHIIGLLHMHSGILHQPCGRSVSSQLLVDPGDIFVSDIHMVLHFQNLQTAILPFLKETPTSVKCE